MDLTNQYCYFYEDEKFNETDRAGFRRRVINGELRPSRMYIATAS